MYTIILYLPYQIPWKLIKYTYINAETRCKTWRCDDSFGGLYIRQKHLL
jgi:hypothetical protein